MHIADAGSTTVRKDGRWPVQHKYAGKTFFEMEKTGGPSRWNTLRALRVLRWWHAVESYSHTTSLENSAKVAQNH
jgi:hypothetical protein